MESCLRIEWKNSLIHSKHHDKTNLQIWLFLRKSQGNVQRFWKNSLTSFFTRRKKSYPRNSGLKTYLAPQIRTQRVSATHFRLGKKSFNLLIFYSKLTLFTEKSKFWLHKKLHPLSSFLGMKKVPPKPRNKWSPCHPPLIRLAGAWSGNFYPFPKIKCGHWCKTKHLLKHSMTSPFCMITKRHRFFLRKSWGVGGE